MAIALAAGIGSSAQAEGCDRSVATGGRTWVGASSAGGPQAELPDDATLDRQAALDFDWTDASRQRDVPVRLYWPRAASGATANPGAPIGAAQIPLVVFSHGIGGSRTNYSYFGRFLAAQGVASLHVQHVGSDRSLWTGNLLLLMLRLNNAAQESEAIARVQDLHFALDQLLAGPLGTRVDPCRIVVAGHSYGANTAMLAVGAQFERAGWTLNYRDPRYAAAVLISAPPFYGEPNAAAILRSVDVPTLHVTGTDDVIAIPGYKSGVDDRIALYDAFGGRKAFAMFDGGAHSTFTDRTTPGGIERNRQVKAATRELVMAFMGRVFQDDKAGMERWRERWKSILARYLRTD